MAHSARTVRIAAASILALVMVGGSYLLSGPTPWGRIVEAESAEELLKAYAAKDTDTDGLPDWQESLYGTNPNDPESFQAGMKDGEAVAQGLVTPKVAVRPADEPTDIDSIPGKAAAPSSITDRFAQAFLSQYLNNRGERVPTVEEMNAFVEGGIADLLAEGGSPARYGTSDVAASPDSSDEGLRAYVVAVERAFEANEIPGRKSELAHFSDALKGDTGALASIAAISREYAGIERDLMLVPVPAEFRQAHLAMANAFAHLSEASADLAAMDEDPVRALVGLSLYKQYPDDVLAGFANLYAILEARQISFAEGMPGFDAYTSAKEAAH